METCVLIPPEFSLILTQDSTIKNDSSSSANGCSPKKRKFVYEMGVRVWSNQNIDQGTRFMPFNGTIRLDKLEVYSTLEDSDVRQQYGCYDEIQEVDGQKVRHCNWIRFLRVATSPASPDVNIIGSKVSGEPFYEVIKTVKPNTELVVFYGEHNAHSSLVAKASKMIPEDLSFNESRVATKESINEMTPEQYKYTMNAIIEDSPLDLSLSLLSSRILITPPSDSEESKCSDPRPSPSHSPSPSYKSSESLSIKNIPDMKTSRRGRERHMLPCEVCGKAFDRPSLLRRHMRTHTGEKPHVCDVCGKGFSTSSSLNTHRRIHSGEKPHQCPVCGKRFTASSNLYYHRMTHNKEKPHKCKLCSKSFPTPGDLKSHMYVHNGSWPYKCTICNRGFSKQTNLRNHLFLHTGDKPHQCNVCQKRFALACNLRAHLKTHDTVQHEDCLKCGRRMTNTKNECSTSGLCNSCMQPSSKSTAPDMCAPNHFSEPAAAAAKGISAQEALASLAKNEQYLRHHHHSSNYSGDLNMFYTNHHPHHPHPRGLSSSSAAAAAAAATAHLFQSSPVVNAAASAGLLRTAPFFHIT